MKKRVWVCRCNARWSTEVVLVFKGRKPHLTKEGYWEGVRECPIYYTPRQWKATGNRLPAKGTCTAGKMEIKI